MTAAKSLLKAVTDTAFPSTVTSLLHYHFTSLPHCWLNTAPVLMSAPSSLSLPSNVASSHDACVFISMDFGHANFLGLSRYSSTRQRDHLKRDRKRREATSSGTGECEPLAAAFFSWKGNASFNPVYLHLRLASSWNSPVAR